MPSLDLDLQVCHSLYSATNALIRAYRPLLEPLGLTYPQYIVMLSLWQEDNVSVKALSSHTRLDSGTLTPILKRLEKQGLLTREVFGDDERQKRLVLTKKGTKLRTAAEKVPVQISCLTANNVEGKSSDIQELRGEQLKNAKQLKQLCEELFHVLHKR